MPKQGDTLSHYLLGRLVGQGGCGAVHLAWDRQAGKPVAIKLLSADGGPSGEGRDDLRRLFIDESRLAMQLAHPDIVSVLDAGEQAGQLWQAMEWVQGHPLSRYTEGRRLLPPPLVLDVGVRVARALHYVHEAGIVHRDLKPSNVLVDLSRAVVKVSDFGTARLLDGSRTRTGVLLGTPAYMSPEQLAGAPSAPSGDIYSLGVLLFELLTGRRPHEAASMGQFMRRVAIEPAPDLRELWAEAPVALAQAIAWGLQRRASDRVSSAADFAEELSRVRLHAWGPPALA